LPRRRFVILEHDHPFLHWDLLLETDSLLTSWRLLQQPRTGRSVDAERLPDHRPLYLDYEGPVGKDRGSVKRIAAGTFEDVGQTTVGEADVGESHAANATRYLRLFDWPVADSAVLFEHADGTLIWQFSR